MKFIILLLLLTLSILIPTVLIQIPLVTTILSSSGITVGEFYSGLTVLFIVFSLLIYVLTFRGRL